VKAKELKPDDPTAYTTLANFYNSQGDFEKTIEALTEAANLRPEDPQGYQLVAVYYWKRPTRTAAHAGPDEGLRP
jgi:predicted Zn-dependent protease